MSCKWKVWIKWANIIIFIYIMNEYFIFIHNNEPYIWLVELGSWNNCISESVNYFKVKGLQKMSCKFNDMIKFLLTLYLNMYFQTKGFCAI